MTLKKYLLIAFSFLLISCGCKDDGFESFELNEFEKTVIPFKTEVTKKFVNENAQVINGVASVKTVDNFDLNSSDDESCFTSLAEIHKSTYQFDNSNKTYYVQIVKRKFNNTEFVIYSDEQEYYSIQHLETQNLEEELTDLSIDGFTFTKVFNLTSNNTETEFERIVYSVENGIEFIKYRNGSYLKLSE